MSLVLHYRAMAAYNRWMNERLYAVVAPLSDEERRRDRGAFFGSIHGTLNHLLLADRVWIGRLHGEPITITSLDQELYADFEQLRAERQRSDGHLERWMAELGPEQLDETVTYQSRFGPFSHPLWFALSHLFNHQTHHRGQLTTLLAQLKLDYGSTDLIAFLRQSPPR
jgi:uncharacterized damage-inducible protein DinB